MKMVFLTFSLSFEVFEAHFHIEIFLIEKKTCKQTGLWKLIFLKNFLIKKNVYVNWNKLQVYRDLQLFPTKQLHFLSFPYFGIQNFKDWQNLQK